MLASLALLSVLFPRVLAADPPPAAKPSGAAPTVVVVESTAPGVTFAQTLANTFITKDICIAPCTVEAEPGMYTIVAYGRGVPSASVKVDLRPGTTTTIHMEAGSAGLASLGSGLLFFGTLGAVTGITFVAVNAGVKHDPFTPGLAYGLTGGGLVMAVGGKLINHSARSKLTVLPGGGAMLTHTGTF
jgi:hypothetical protein